MELYGSGREPGNRGCGVHREPSRQRKRRSPQGRDRAAQTRPGCHWRSPGGRGEEPLLRTGERGPRPSQLGVGRKAGRKTWGPEAGPDLAMQTWELAHRWVPATGPAEKAKGAGAEETGRRTGGAAVPCTPDRAGRGRRKRVASWKPSLLGLTASNRASASARMRTGN